MMVKRKQRRRRRRRQRGGYMGTIARAAFEEHRRAKARREAYDLKHTPRNPNAYKRELFADLKKQGINFK